MHARQAARIGRIGGVLTGCVIALGSLNIARAQFDNVLHLKEIGSGPNGAVELEFRFGFPAEVKSLTSPSGQVFNSASVLQNRLFGDLIKTFPSLTAALSFMPGTWQGTYALPFPINSPTMPFEFEIGPVALETLDRELPQNFSLGEGARIRNGEPFLMTWDFASAQAAHRTWFQTSPNDTSTGVRIFSSPQSTGSSSSSGGSADFNRMFVSQSGPSQNNWLTTFTATPNLLPLDVDVLFGVNTSLNSFVTNPPSSDPNPFNRPPTMAFMYSRLADPFEVTVIRVPEPATWAMGLMLPLGLLTRIPPFRGKNVGCRRHMTTPAA